MSNGGQILNSSGARRTHAGESLADVLDRILDKGVVIAGDIAIAVVGIELLTIKVRLLIASADKAAEMGIDWWRSDPFLAGAKIAGSSEGQGDPKLLERIQKLESRLGDAGAPAKESTVRRKRRSND